MNMPGITGLELLVEVGRLSPDTARIMITGVEDQKVAANAVNTGRVFKFLAKPCALRALVEAVQEASAHYVQVRRDREVLEQTFNGIVTVLTEVLAAAEPQVFASGQRLRERARAVGHALGIRHTWELEAAALLLRIGAATIPDTVRQKERQGGALDGIERDLVERIPALGASLLENIPRLVDVADIVRHQNADYDAAGRSGGSATHDGIPLGARILRVLVDLQGVESAGHPAAIALAQLRENPAHYDPVVLRCLEDLVSAPGGGDNDKPVMIADLKPGMVVAVAVSTRENVVVVPSGTRLSPVMLGRLRNFAELGELIEPVYIQEDPAMRMTLP
jgi:response regulator RpfG family c-di-GMP phosphodiesterase